MVKSDRNGSAKEAPCVLCGARLLGAIVVKSRFLNKFRNKKVDADCRTTAFMSNVKKNLSTSKRKVINTSWCRTRGCWLLRGHELIPNTKQRTAGKGRTLENLFYTVGEVGSWSVKR